MNRVNKNPNPIPKEKEFPEGRSREDWEAPYKKQRAGLMDLIKKGKP